MSRKQVAETKKHRKREAGWEEGERKRNQEDRNMTTRERRTREK